MNYLEKKGIVSGVQVSKTDDSGKVIKSFIYDFNGSGWDKRDTPVAETTSMGGTGGINVGNGGDSIEHDVNAFGDSNFMKAGNKLNKEEAMPIVKRSIGEGVKVGQIYMNGSGRAKIEKIIDRNSIQIRRWGDTTANTVNVGVNELSGWTLLEGKKILKLTESQARMITENEQVGQLVSLFQQSINTVDESLNYSEFADAVAYIIKDSYGSHLIEPIMERLRKSLPKQENILPGLK